MRNLRVVLIAYAAMLGLGAQIFAAPKISIKAPTVTFSSTDPLVSPFLSTLNAQLATELSVQATKMEATSNDTLSKYGDQKKLAQGFGNANAYSAQSATVQGYQGYKLFSVMSGLMIGAQLPSFDVAKLQKIPDDIKSDPDLYAGVAPSLDFVNIGINAGTVFGFINKDLGKTFKNFYFNVKFGTLNYNYEYDSKTKLDVKSTNFGLGVNYQFIPRSPSILFGLFQWRGINFGSGVNVQSNSVNLSMTLNKITQDLDIPLNVGTGSVDLKGKMTATPNIKIGVDMTTVSIPLEATTSVQLLWLTNVNFGVGADLVFGSSDINATATSDVTIEGLNTGNPNVTAASVPGSFKLDASTTGIAPQLVRARFMSGWGMNFGPVKIDVPVYYYLASGLAFGVSVGIVW